VPAGAILAGLAALAVVGLVAVVLWQRGLPARPKEPLGEEELLALSREPRKDFDLKVAMKGGWTDRSGAVQLHHGDEVTFEIELSRDAYVGIWTIDPDQKTVRQIFPNEYEKENFLRAGKRELPGKESRFTAEAATGAEWAWVVAATRDWDRPRGEQDGPFFVLKTTEQRRDFRDRLRTLKARPRTSEDDMQVADVVLRYRVSQAPRQK
jgi:hypothetical protein